jgi:ligand-binding sensor domain-containing protein
MYDSEGSLWVSTKGRLLYRDSSGNWQWIEPSDLEQTIWFSDIYLDANNTIWLVSLTEGLWQARPSEVNRYRDSEQLNQTVTTINVSDGNKLWLATRSGIGYLDENNKFQIELPTQQLDGLTVYDLHFQGNNLLIATNKGVFTYSDDSLRKLDSALLRRSAVFAIEAAVQGGMWLATDQGLYRLMYNGLRSFVYNSFLESKYITFVDETKNQGYIGTSRGAYGFNERGIERLAMGSKLADSHISFILPVEEKLFVSTQNNGLFYRNEALKWQQIDVSNGLPYGPILSLNYDQALQQLWVSTSKGVYRLPIKQFEQDLQTLQVEQIISPYNKQLDGEVSQCCSGNALGAVARIGNSVWYPSKSGLVEIPTNIVLFSDNEIKPIIETVTTDNVGNQQVYSVAEQSQLNLAKNERNITLAYTAINFQPASTIDFRYRLVGLDAAWREAHDSREANYANLPAGQFTFELQAKRQGQEWDTAKTIAKTLSIPKSFDETVFFRLLIVMSCLIAIYFVFLIYRNQEKRKQEQLPFSRNTYTSTYLSKCTIK